MNNYLIYLMIFLGIILSPFIGYSSSLDPDPPLSKLEQLKINFPNFEQSNFMGNSDCPDVEFIDLRNIAGYPQLDDVTACGAADTLSMIIFTGDVGEIQGFELELDLPSGIEYGGFEFAQLGKTSITLSENNPSKPVFFVDGITGDSLVIVNIGLRANCEVDKLESLFLDYNYKYFYTDTLDVLHKCEATFRPEGELNSSINIPVLNMLSPLSPADLTFSSLASPHCQTIQISQDGLSAYVDSFTFEIVNLDLSSDVMMTSVSVNGIAYPMTNVAYDAATMTSSLLVDGNFFPANSFSNPADNQMNTDELVEIEICYQTDVCPSTSDIPFSYNAKFGCDEEICDNSVQSTFLFIRPIGALLPTATATLNAGGIEICGTPGQVSVTLNNPNTNTDQNTYTDLQIGFQTCNKPNLDVTGVTVGGVPIPATFYSWIGDDINIDFSANTDATIGLVDYDNDGFFDDLPGGSSISAEILIEVSCGLNPDECALIDCQDVQFYVEANRNCGTSFKDFPVPDAFDLLYGPTAVSNPTEAEFGTTGIFGYDFGVYSNNGAPLSTDESTIEVEFCYTFDKLNIEDCPSGATNFFKVDFLGAARFMKDLAFTPNSASWSIDGGTTYVPIPDADVNLTKATDESATLILNAGSIDSDVCYKYSITLDSCICAPVGYFSGKQQVVSSCSDCTGGCEILKACRTTTFRGDATCSDCSCIVDQGIYSSERSNFGYTDKIATTQHTRESLTAAGGAIDITRFLPGDTLTHYEFYVIKNDAALQDLSRWAFSWYLVDQTENSLTSENLDLSLDAHNATLDKFQFSKSGAAIRSDIDLSTMSNCINDPDYNYGSIWNGFNTTPWDNTIGHQRTQNSGSDLFDNNDLLFYIWNFSDVVDCGASNAHLGGDNSALGQGNCLDELITTLNIEVGDTIHFQWTSPLIINPFRAAKKILGTETALSKEAKIRSNFAVYLHDPVSGNTTYCDRNIGNACIEYSPIFFDLAGEIDVTTRMNLDDCGGTVEHVFTVQDLPGEVSDPWFTKEYRPFMDITRVNGLIRAPLAYCANAQVEKLDVIYDVSVDSSQNVFCAPVAGYDENICGVEEGQTTGNIFFNLTDQGVPALGIGFDNCDTLRLSYDLCMVCPQDIAGISEYDLFYDWSYVNTIKERDENFIANQYYCNISGATQLARSICDDHSIASGKDWFNLLALDSLSNKTDRLSEVFLLTDNRNAQAPVTIENLGANLLASGLPGSSEEIQEISIHNTDATMGATGVGASVSIPSSVRLVNVYTDAGGTSPLTTTLVSDDGAYKVYNVTLPSDSYAANEENSIFVGTTLLYCPNITDPAPNVCVTVYSGCASTAVKAVLGKSDACEESQICYAYIFGEVGLQTEWFDSPSSSALCEEITFNVRIKNVKELVLLDLVPSFDLPPGLEPVSGSWEVSYPGGEVAALNWQAIGSDPDIVSGNSYAYSEDASWSALINANGLQGVSTDNITLDSNKVAFRFRAVTVCDQFLSGSRLLTTTTATDPCAEEVISSGLSESPGVIIDNANPVDYAQLLLVVDPKESNCMGYDNTFGVTAINIGDKSTSDSVLVCLTLPEELDFTAGSVAFTSPSGFVPNWVTETAIGTSKEVCFNAPSLGPYGTFSFEFDAVMEEQTACGDIRLGTDIKSFIDAVTCSPGPPTTCGVFVQNSIQPTVRIKLKPPFIAEDLVVYTDCSSDPSTMDLYYEWTINHDGPTALNQTYTVNFYEDIDEDESINTNIDNLLGTDNGTFSVADGNAITISGNVLVDADKSCPVLFEVVYATSCNCDREEQYFTNIKTKALRDFTEPISMCPGECFDIEVCDFVNVTSDSIRTSTGVVYELSLDWKGADTYTLPSPGSPRENITYESMTNNDIDPSLNNALIAEANTGNGYIVATFPYIVNVNEVFLGGGNIAGWSNVIHVYGPAELLFEYSLDGINWVAAANGPIIPNTASIQGTIIDPPVAGQYFRITSSGNNSNWATSEFRLEGAAVPFSSASPITKTGSTVSLCIPEGVGITEPWLVNFSTGTGACEIIETMEIWNIGGSDFSIEGKDNTCGAECFSLEVTVPNDATTGMSIQWTPSMFIDDPSAFEVEVCNLTESTTFNATISYSDGACSSTVTHPVTYYPINTINISPEVIECYVPFSAPILSADAGWDTYEWYELIGNNEILLWSSFSNIYIAPGPGTYIVKAATSTSQCPAISSTVIVPDNVCCQEVCLPVNVTIMRED